MHNRPLQLVLVLWAGWGLLAHRDGLSVHTY